MKKTDKNSRNKGNRGNDDTLIYILLLLLVALLVGLGIWWWHEWNKPKQVPNYNYELKLGKRETSPTSKDITKLLSTNHDLEKSIRRDLTSENRRKKVSTSLKEEVEKELDSIIGKTNDIIKETHLESLEPEMLALIYSKLYEQGKRLVELKYKASDDIPFEELKKQYEIIQPNWEITPSEEKEIDTVMNEWINKWYNRAMEGKTKLKEIIVPLYIDGKKIENPTPAQIALFRDFHKWEKEGKKCSIDLTKPVQLDFNGYGGFMTPEDSKNSTEGTNTVGVTLSSPGAKMTQGEAKKGEPGHTKWYYTDNNYRSLEIRLLKELFINRSGYDNWITKIEEDGKSSSIDANFDGVVETIAHELAHAVIQSTIARYRGERKGGHGKLHDDMTDQIENMMRTSPDFSQFKAWWNKKKNGG